MNETFAKLEGLLKNEEKAKKIFTGSKSQVLANLAANGINLSEQELDAIIKGVKEAEQQPTSEDLSPEELGAVVGGC